MRHRRRGHKSNFDAYLTDHVMDDIHKEDNERRALRKALLHCIMLLDGDNRASRQEFREYLMAHFRPLSDQFIKDRHDYFGEIDVMRARNADGKLTLLVPTDRLKALLDRERLASPDVN